MDAVWCGVVEAKSFSENEQNIRKELEQAVKTRKWDEMFAVLGKRPYLVNAAFLDDPKWNAPLHQLVEDNAPAEIVEKAAKLGAWLTLKDFNGNKAVDIANRKGNQHLVEDLNPVYCHPLNPEMLSKIQEYFHQVIIGRINVIPEWRSFRLPDLEILLEIEEPNMWFPVPGMYGGFNYELLIEGEVVKLVSSSWCRIVGGSGERHEITSEGIRLIEKGYV